MSGTGARPRVAVVAHDVHWHGGQERALAEVIDRLADAVDFHVVSGTLDDRLAERVRWHEIRGPRRPFALWYPWFWARATRVVRALDVDLVHTCGAVQGGRADVAMLSFSHHGYVHETGSWVPQGAHGARWAQFAVLRAMSLAAERWCYRPLRLRVLAPVSDRAAEEARRFHPGIGVEVIPNGVDLDRFVPDPTARDEVRGEMEVDAAPVCLFVGGDWERKGLPQLIAAVGRTRAPVELWVVGVGDVPRHRAMAEACGAADRVRFLGHRDDVERWFAAADVFCLPTEYETFSMVTYEAAACGLPLLATAVGGIEDLVVEGVSGWFVERTAESIAVRLDELASDPERRAAMGRAAAQAAQGFGWDVAAERTRALYDRLWSPR